MSCSFVVDYASAVSANVFYYPTDSSCLGLPGYVNGSDCASWPVASASPVATFIWSPAGGSATTSTCSAPVFTSEVFPNLARTIVPCNVQNSIFSTAGAASYIFPTSGTTAMSTFTWSIGSGPSATATSDISTPYVVSTYTVASATTIPTTWTTMINSTSTVITTQITTITTLTQLSTLTAGTTTVMGRLQRRQTCVAKGPIGSYAVGSDPSALTYTDLVYSTTSSWISTVTPTSYSTLNTTVSNISNTTTTLVSSATATQNTITTVPAATVTETGSTGTTYGSTTADTTASVATGTLGPYALSIVAFGTTITEGLTRRSLPTASVRRKRQSNEGWVGLADQDGTVGVVSSEANALQFYVINGELVADVGGVDWYTYTENSIIADPGYETWVLQSSPPGTDSIATEWQGVELDSLDWVNDAFIGTGMAQICVGSPLDGGTINVIDFWYDTTLSPPGGACDLVSASIVAVEPTAGPSSTETVTSQTTVTSISTITGPPVTSYVCNNGGMCPNACTYDTNLVTTEVCSTASDGLSTCAACLASTPLPIIETDLAWVTSTVECATPPCQVVTQLAAPAANTPCNGDNTVTVYANNGSAGTAVVAAGAAAAADTVAAGADTAATDAATAAATSTPTPTTKSTTRTGTPTASPSIGLAGKVELRSSSIMALIFAAGAFFFLA
ncbi:hypothetical protein TWF730_007488 [Orbilia blumenaviensis]|uniref:Uncharacterized protein n=1 Tax=Orbilia blumenaviensis TaxID=1796055 RepID=A0AAV9V8M8_9PEZI